MMGWIQTTGRMELLRLSATPQNAAPVGPGGMTQRQVFREMGELVDIAKLA